MNTIEVGHCVECCIKIPFVHPLENIIVIHKEKENCHFCTTVDSAATSYTTNKFVINDMPPPKTVDMGTVDMMLQVKDHHELNKEHTAIINWDEEENKLVYLCNCDFRL